MLLVLKSILHVEFPLDISMLFCIRRLSSSESSAVNYSWSFVNCVIILCVSLLSYVHCFMCVLL